MKPYSAMHTPPTMQVGMELTNADEGIEEAQQHAVDRGDGDGADGGVARDGDAADGLAVGGVGAAAKQRAHDGARRRRPAACGPGPDR